MTDDELYMCKYAEAGVDKDGFTIPWCKTQDMACEDVLRFRNLLKQARGTFNGT